MMNFKGIVIYGAESNLEEPVIWPENILSKRDVKWALKGDLRRRILNFLALRGDAKTNVKDIWTGLKVKYFSAVYKEINDLERAGIVKTTTQKSEKKGRGSKIERIVESRIVFYDQNQFFDIQGRKVLELLKAKPRSVKEINERIGIGLFTDSILMALRTYSFISPTGYKITDKGLRILKIH